MTGALRQFTARQRDTGFDPLSIGWHAAFWAEDPDWTDPGDGNAVSSWRNAGSGDFGDAVQAEAAYQPTYHASHAPFNNRPILLGDVTDDFLMTGIGTTIAQPNTWVVIGAATASNPGQHLMDGRATDLRTTVYSWGNVNWIAGTNRTVGTDLGVGVDASANLVLAEANGVSSVLEVDGVEIDAGDIGAQGLNGLTLFSYRLSGGGYGGKIAFAGIYNGLLSAQDKADLLAWSQSHYGTPS